MRRLLYFLKDYRKESVLGPLFKLLEASFELLVPLVVAALGAEGRSEIEGLEHVDRGYHRLEDTLTALGACIRRV